MWVASNACPAQVGQLEHVQQTLPTPAAKQPEEEWLTSVLKGDILIFWGMYDLMVINEICFSVMVSFQEYDHSS